MKMILRRVKDPFKDSCSWKTGLSYSTPVEGLETVGLGVLFMLLDHIHINRGILKL